MPLSHRLENGIYRVSSTLEINPADLRPVFEQMRTSGPVGDAIRVLIEDHASKFNPAPDELRAVAALLRDVFSDVPTAIAVVVERELHYGLGRMIEVFTEGANVSFHVFREKEDAVAWLKSDRRSGLATRATGVERER